MSSHDSPFAAILRGDEPGTVIARDDDRQFAIIASVEPEAAVHWIAVPYEAGQTTEMMERANRERFLELIDYAIDETRARVADYPALGYGFTIKFHPSPAGGRGKSLALTVTMPHGCNLKDMTPQERLIGEKYLRLWGILKDDNDEGDVLE